MASFGGNNNSWRSTSTKLSESADYKIFIQHSDRLNSLNGRSADRYGGGGGAEGVDFELSAIFDQLNCLDYYTQFLTEPVCIAQQQDLPQY